MADESPAVETLAAHVGDLLAEWRSTCKQMGLRWTESDAAAFVAAGLSGYLSPEQVAAQTQQAVDAATRTLRAEVEILRDSADETNRWLREAEAEREQAVDAALGEVVAGVRAWCSINEIAEPPLDWEGLGEFLARVTPPDSPETRGGEDRG